MITSQWIVFYFAIALHSGPLILDALYEALPVKTHVFEMGRRFAKLAQVGLTKTISYAEIRYTRKYNLRLRGRVILEYYLKLAVSHVEGFQEGGGGIYTKFMINNEGLMFNLNARDPGCSIYHYPTAAHLEAARTQLRITDWWLRLVYQFNIINAQYYYILRMTPDEIRDLAK
jgi:hypothetical protein